MVQASAGLVSVNGAPEAGPVRIGVPVVDLSTGMNACIGILMALYERNRSGKGQFVDATLYDSAIALHQPHAPNYFMAGMKPKLYGNSHGNLAPYANFPTRDRDGEAFPNELMKAGVPSGAVQEVPDVMEHPHTRHRNMVWEKDGYRNVGNPIKLSRTPPTVRSKPRKYGIDTRAVLAERGFSGAEIDKLIAAGVALTEIRK
jgi:crotonobetainyl-CoA:carnitine CoA-transferase CaiB-like acyl-CoA transferase